MKRKLIKQGLGGYTIYLPKKWIDSRKLSSGDEISVIERAPNLIISSEKKENREAEINLGENKTELKVLLTHYYRSGFVKIKINGINDNALKEIKNITKNLLMGFEMTSFSGNTCILENISEPDADKYEILFKRAIFLTKETIKDLILEFKNSKFSIHKEIEDISFQHDQIVLFCRRIIMKSLYEKNPVSEWEILTFMMHIQHSLFYLSKFGKENKVKSKSVNILLEKLLNYFEMFEEALLNNDMEKVNEINKLRNELQFGLCLDFLKKSKGNETIAISYIREIFRLIQVGTSPIIVKIMDKI